MAEKQLHIDTDKGNHPFPMVGQHPHPPITFAEGEEDDSVFLGNPLNYWRYDPANGFDLTRNAPASDTFSIETTTSNVKLSRSKTAVIIVDMQNFFLHPAIRDHPTGLAATKVLTDSVLPACHERGVQVIYVNWGLSAMDLQNMPPALIKGFSRDALPSPKTAGRPSASATKPVYKGMGQPMGSTYISSADPSKKGEAGEEGAVMVEGGPLLSRGSWNAELYTPLKDDFEKYSKVGAATKLDHLAHKNRLSGLWGGGTPLETFLKDEGITTTIWAGVNTDQCVSGSFYDAYSKGYDVILLKDCCGTSSPIHATETIEYNVERSAGFMISGATFAECLRASA